MIVNEEGACAECGTELCTHIRGYFEAIRTEEVEPLVELLQRTEKYLARQHGMIAAGLLDAIRAHLYPDTFDGIDGAPDA